MMSDLNLSATPTVEEWLDVCEPGLKKATLGLQFSYIRILMIDIYCKI